MLDHETGRKISTRLVREDGDEMEMESVDTLDLPSRLQREIAARLIFKMSIHS